MTFIPNGQAPEVLPVVEAEGDSLRRFLRPSQIIEKTGLPSEVIYTALTAGELVGLDVSRPPRPGKRHKPVWYVDPEDLRAWLEAKKTRTGGK